MSLRGSVGRTLTTKKSAFYALVSGARQKHLLINPGAPIRWYHSKIFPKTFVLFAMISLRLKIGTLQTKFHASILFFRLRLFGLLGRSFNVR
jgi:hypothetical protein